MRLWSIHPKYLDPRGLVALWREGLLAQKVLRGETSGYQNHPQLERFRTHPQPERAIGVYLRGIWEEAEGRGYRFDGRKIGSEGVKTHIPLTHGQLRFEFDLLSERLRQRDPSRYQELLSVREVEPHPIFEVIEGKIEDWEKAASA